MAPYPIFFRALKTIIMPNFMLLTESEQLKHISALLKYSQKDNSARNSLRSRRLKVMGERKNRIACKPQTKNSRSNKKHKQSWLNKGSVTFLCYPIV